MQQKAPQLSIVIPCYNEEQNIRFGALEKVNNYLQKQTLSWEVLIIDDGSQDATAELVRKYIKNKPKLS